MFKWLLNMLFGKPATEEVEYRVRPWRYSKERIVLDYRFKGKRIWETIHEFDSGEDLFRPYGSFTEKLFHFHPDGNYRHLKEVWTKKAILEHNKEIQKQYQNAKKTKIKKEQIESLNVKKRI
jgi:hypothetical protein